MATKPRGGGKALVTGPLKKELFLRLPLSTPYSLCPRKSGAMVSDQSSSFDFLHDVLFYILFSSLLFILFFLLFHFFSFFFSFSVPIPLFPLFSLNFSFILAQCLG